MTYKVRKGDIVKARLSNEFWGFYRGDHLQVVKVDESGFVRGRNLTSPELNENVKLLGPSLPLLAPHEYKVFRKNGEEEDERKSKRHSYRLEILGIPVGRIEKDERCDEN